ncbi:MAG: stalk domain-containing protein [Clostridia bacterium]|nr:stalk domain-containing protein [Clostridia bacterium]
MNKLKNILVKLGRNLFFICILTVAGALTVYTIVQAMENSSSSSGTSSSDSSSTSSTENKLTAEEIDKIVEDLKISGNIDNILEKLDDIIYRAQLSGNSALQEYATNMKTKYELQKQLDSVNGLLSSMKKKNSGIAKVDTQVTKILSVSTITEDLRGAVSDECLIILESLSEDNVKNLQETYSEIETIVDIKDVASLTVQQRSLLDVLLLSKIIEDNMVEGERLTLAKETLSVAITILKSYERQNYASEDYDKLVEDSDKFTKAGRKASSVIPEQIVFLNGYFKMKHAPIMYDGHILMAIDDLYQYIDASIEYMYNNATMVIQSPGKILEIVSGKNEAYLNDQPKNIPVPILSYNDNIYMSVEFFAECYDISYKYVADEEFLILYYNLVQVENQSVPNELHKD